MKKFLLAIACLIPLAANAEIKLFNNSDGEMSVTYKYCTFGQTLQCSNLSNTIVPAKSSITLNDSFAANYKNILITEASVKDNTGKEIAKGNYPGTGCYGSFGYVDGVTYNVALLLDQPQSSTVLICKGFGY